uniref:Mitochondrial import inner membrane translocase subunit n=1 Tax=Eptatretus burgeri TaxID=7764 RepID=A0A8C4R524_EPTBU
MATLKAILLDPLECDVSHLVVQDKCMDKPSSKLDGRTETCLVNCVERFIDTSQYLLGRFEKISLGRLGGSERLGD